MTDAGAQPYTTVGREFTKISVSISYRIIELFSAGLYKSPNKAIEELVSNSWDAEAQHAWLFISPNLSAADAAVWVVDDGTSMNLQGLVDLWQIAESPKLATRNDQKADRPQIGKFGIGKLATYLLARRLTYICKKGRDVLAATMDYDKVDRTSSPGSEVTLGVRRLKRTDVEAALVPLRALDGGSDLADELLDTLDDVDASWTVATLSSLKPQARAVQIGMVRWLLATALPRSPGFAIHLNGAEIIPASEKIKPLKRWSLGANPGVEPKALPRGAREVKGKKASDAHVVLDQLPGRVTGYVEVYEDVLTKNKSSEWGRSHGYFVQVRGRLVNIDDALFGMPALSHASFNRFRMVVNADGLDDFLASTRESVQDNEQVRLFQAYLRAEFNRARNFYEEWLEKQATESHLPSRIDRTAASLSRGPLVSAVRELIEGDIIDLALIKRPATAGVDIEAFLQSLEQTLEDGATGPIEDVTLAALGNDHYLAVYDPNDRVVRVNTLHPFYANFIDTLGRSLPFKLLAVTEVLTEAYALQEAGAQAARNIVASRDAFLRELVNQNREGPAVVAQNLRDMMADANGLEEAVADAMRSLGYEVTRIGGSGKPDGLAKAVIGAQSADGFDRDDYAITYDTKSTGSKAVKAHTVGISTLVRHRTDYGAQHILVVAPAFEGGNDPNSALGKECAKHSVTPVTVQDLASLVEVQAGKMLGYTKLRELYACRTTKQSGDWIESLRDLDDEAPPLVEVLEVIDDLRTRDRPSRVGPIALLLEERYGLKCTEKQVQELLAILRGLAPGYVTVVGDRVTLETSPDKVRHAIARHYREIPPGLTDPSFEKSMDPHTESAQKPQVARRPTKSS